MEINQATIEALRSISTPTVSNAIELFDLRPRNEGYMSPEIRCLFPDLGVMVGSAVTLRFGARHRSTDPKSRYDSWQYILKTPAPRILVMQDMDNPPGSGAYIGEVMTTIHQRLGCIGAVTNGCVRDLDEVRSLGFHFFAAGVCVSHAYVHLMDFGCPVNVGGILVRTGDLIHADKHGVLLVPNEIAAEVPKAAAKVCEREQQLLALCKSPAFTLEELKRLYES